MKALKAILSVLGPGIFAIGYTIGTGSVTSMAKAGADYGLGLLWVLALSCLFSGVLMEAYGRMAAVTGETSLRAIRDHLPCGKAFAWLVFAGVVIGQYTCLGGILTLSSGAIAEMLGGKVPPFAIAGIISAVMYAFLMIGRYSAFEKILAFFVGVMALTFLASVFMVGVLAAGLSSVFPILMVAPILVSDYRSGSMETNTPLFRWICLGACLWGLVVPALGGNPIVVTIAAQISNVFVLPLTIMAILLLLNRKDLMGAHRAGIATNVGLGLALAFSLVVAYSGVKAFIGVIYV